MLKFFKSFDENDLMILHTTQKPLLRLTIGTSKKLKAIPCTYQNHIKMCIFYPSDSIQLKAMIMTLKHRYVLTYTSKHVMLT